MALSVIDEKFGITDRIVAGLDEIGENTQSYAERVKDNLHNRVNEATASIIDYAIDTSKRIVVNFAKHQISKFLSNKPRIY